jgi:IrrE N-terminal-like domain
MIPGTINVAGINYSVMQVEGINDRFNTWGQVDYSKGIIEIDSSISKARKEQTLVHEILHACFHDAGFEEQDEDMINRVGIVLYQVLKDNHLYFGEVPYELHLPSTHELTSIDKWDGK